MYKMSDIKHKLEIFELLISEKYHYMTSYLKGGYHKLDGHLES